MLRAYASRLPLGLRLYRAVAATAIYGGAASTPEQRQVFGTAFRVGSVLWDGGRVAGVVVGGESVAV